MTKQLFMFFLLITTSSWCQKEAVITLPETAPLYSGYYNAVEISYKKRKIKKVSLECDYCDTVKKHPKIDSRWIIMAGDSNYVTLTFKQKNGKVIGEKKFPVLPPKTPTMYFDSINAQSVLTTLPERLIAKYKPHVPLHSSFVTRNWEIEIGDKTFKGAGSRISEEVRKHLKTVQKGIVIIDATFLGPNGSFGLKEIFEFNIE